MSNPIYTLIAEIEPHYGATIDPVELKLVAPKVTKVEGPYNAKDELLEHVGLGETYYYYATLNVSASSINPKQVNWAVGYDTEKFEKQYKLFSGKEIKNNKVRISISIGGSKEIKKKVTEKFKIYAYLGVNPDTEIYAEIKKEILEISFPVLIARSRRRAGNTIDSEGNDATKEDIKNLGFSLPKSKEKLKRKLNDAYDELGYTKGWFSDYTDKEYKENKEKRVKYALEQLESYNEKTDDELFSIYQNDLDDWAQGELDDNLINMISFFKTNTDTSNIYEDDRLTNAIAIHSSTTNFTNGVSPLIGQAIQEAEGDLSLLKVNDDKTQYNEKEIKVNEEILGIEGLQELNSLKYTDKYSGLGISVDGTQAYNISITEYELNGNSYTGKLELEILDHFGLDSPDILKDYIRKNEEFICWYLLQHVRGYKPFITKILIEYSFQGNLNTSNLTLERNGN